MPRIAAPFHSSESAGRGSMLGNVLAFALPLALTSILQQLFNTADAAISGRLIDANALASVGATESVVSLLVSFFVGLSVGANVLVAKLVGEHSDGEIQKAVHTVMAIAIASGILLLALGQVVSVPLLVAVATPASVLGDATVYLSIYFFGMPAIMVYNFASAILRSKGDTMRPLLALLAGCVVNLVLDVAWEYGASHGQPLLRIS